MSKKKNPLMGRLFSQVDLEDGNNFDEFIQVINSNIGFIAQKSHSECESFLSCFPLQVKQLIRVSLAESVLEFYDLKDQYRKKSTYKSTITSIIEDILTYSKLLLRMPDQIKSYDFSKIFSKKQKKSKKSQQNLKGQYFCFNQRNLKPERYNN